MIEAKNLSFSYGKKPVLKDLSFRLEPGRFYGIIGPNGSAKTTLIRLLTRLERPKSGTLLLNGVPYESRSPKELAKELALLPQGRNLPEMTAGQLVSYGRYPYLGLSGRFSKSDEAAISGAMEATDTLPFAELPLKNLSGGERQRVYLAMLLAQDTPYLFLDEPTTYLDIGAQFQLMERLKGLTEKCIVAVLHDLPLALQFCDELLLLENGVLKGAGAPKMLVESGLMDKIFGIKCRILPDGNYSISPQK